MTLTNLRLGLILLLLAAPLLANAAPPPEVRLLTVNPRPFVGEPVTLTMEITHHGLPRQATTLLWPESDQVARTGQPRSEILPAGAEQAGRWFETAHLQLTPLQSGTILLTGGGLSYAGHFIPAGSLQLRVRPLPGLDKPDNFSGLVGELDLELTRSEPADGAPELQLVLSGTGPIKALPLPAPQLAPGIELIKLSDQNRLLSDGRQQRRVRYQYRQRWLWLDRVRFSVNFFNPATNSYETRQVDSGREVKSAILGGLLTLLLVAGLGLYYYRWRSHPRTIKALLSRLLNEPADGMTHQEIRQRLEQAHPDLVGQLHLYWQEHDRQFALGASVPIAIQPQAERELRHTLRKAIDKSGRFPALSDLVPPFKGSF